MARSFFPYFSGCHGVFTLAGPRLSSGQRMKKNEIPVSPMFLATLPLLAATPGFHESFFIAAIVTFAFWTSALFFRVTAPFFPEALKKISLILWVATLAELARDFLGVAPFWAVSLYLLFPQSLLKAAANKKLFFSKRERSVLFWRGFGFWILMAYLGVIGETLAGQFRIGFFAMPAGVFLLLVPAAILSKDKRVGEVTR